jgi:WD40 repeat protein
MALLAVEKEHTFTGHRDSLYALAPTGSEGSFFSAGADGLVVQWQLGTPDQGQLLAKADASIYAMEYLPEQDLLLFGQNYDGIRLVEVSSRRSLDSLQLTKSAIFSLAYWKGLIFVGTGSGQLLVVEQDPLRQQPLRLVRELSLSDQSLRSLAIHPERGELAAGYSDNTIRILDLESLTVKQVLTAHQKSVFTVQYSPDGKYLLSGSRDAHIRIWSVGERYELASSIVAHMYAVNHISYSPDGTLFASCSMDKSVKLWDARSFRLLRVIDKARHAGHGTSVNRLLWLNDQTLASASDDRTISIWSIEPRNTF